MDGWPAADNVSVDTTKGKDGNPIVIRAGQTSAIGRPRSDARARTPALNRSPQLPFP